jgi:outer membrane protein assembly factor BamA
MRGKTALFLAFVAVAFGAGRAEAQEEASPAPVPGTTGPIVKAIEIRSETPIDPKEDLESLLSIEVGKPLSDLVIRRTLANLQASGAIAHAAVYSRPVDGTAANPEHPETPEVVAIVALWASVRVESVRLEGKLGVKEADLRGQVVQREAEPLSEGAVVRGVYRLEDYLIKEGFRTPDVRVRVALPNARTAKVVYQIDAGPRTEVSAVDFEGNLGPWKPEELRAQLRTRIGQPYRSDTLDDDVERLQRWLAKGLYGRARLGVPRVVSAVEEPPVEGTPAAPGPATPETPRVRVTFPVEVGPKIEVRVTGADSDKLKKKGMLPFLGDT